MRNKKFNDFHLQILISFIIIFLVIIYFVDINQNYNNQLSFLLWLNNIAFLLQIYIQKRILKSLINPITLFSIFLFLFSSGQLILYSLNLEIGSFNIFTRLSDESLLQTIPFLILGFTFFQLGVTFIVNKSTSFKYNLLKKFELQDNVVFSVGVLFFLIGFIPYMASSLNALFVVSELGYSAYYQEDTRLNIPFGGFSYYIFTGIIFIVIGGIKRYKWLAILFLIFLSMLSLMSGDRGDGIIFIITAYMLYIYFIKKSRVGLIPTVILVIILMSLVPTIGVLRHSATEATDGFFSLLFENSIITSTLSNLGGTNWPLAKIMEIFPAYEEFTMGGTYLASLIYLVPGILRIGPLSEIASNELFMSPANWLMNYLNMTYGPGFTPFAESFLNFGWGGIVVLYLYGIFIAKIMSHKPKDPKKIPLHLGLGILSFLLLGMSARGSFNNMLAFFVRYVLIPYILVILIKGRINNKK